MRLPSRAGDGEAVNGVRTSRGLVHRRLSCFAAAAAWAAVTVLAAGTDSP